MSDKKSSIIARSKDITTESILPRLPIFSSRKPGYNNLILEYHSQPSGEHEEIYIQEHSIAIFTKVSDSFCQESKVDGYSHNRLLLEGNITITPANITQKTCWYGECEFILLSFAPEYFARIAEELTRMQLQLNPSLIYCDPLIFQMGLALKKIIENKVYNSIYVETMANALAVHLIQQHLIDKPILKQYNNGLSSSKLRLIVDYIQANLERDLHLEELANLVEISPNYFSKLFKHSTGTTPHKYIIQARVKRARELLLGKMTIADIAQVVGFTHQSHLNLHFKRLVGLTPKQFRQNS